VTVRAVDDVSFLSIDSDLLDVMITWDQTGSYEVEELQAQLQSEGSDDWMTTLLQTNAFHRIPPANIRLKLSTLDRDKPYIVYCDTGRRSSAAAYILVERGFDAYVLRGGLSNSGLPLTRGGSDKR
jgi:rhodanese-related sulfurtransferase